MASPKESSTSLSSSSSMSSYFNSLEDPATFTEVKLEELVKIVEEANARINDPEEWIKFTKKERPKPKLVNVNNEYYLREKDFEELKKIEEAEILAKRLSKGLDMYKSGSMGSAGVMNEIIREMNGSLGATDGSRIDEKDDYFGAMNSISTRSGINSISEEQDTMHMVSEDHHDDGTMTVYRPKTADSITYGKLNKAMFKNPRNDSFLLKANCSPNSILNIKNEGGMVELEYSPSVKDVSLNFKSQVSDFFSYENLFKRWRDQNFGSTLDNYRQIPNTKLDTEMNPVSQN